VKQRQGHGPILRAIDPRSFWADFGTVEGLTRHHSSAQDMRMTALAVYPVRMAARVNITVPDALIARAREVGLNVSGMTAEALAEELDRLEKIQGMRDYLDELDAELGPPSYEELRAAREWADAAFPDHPNPNPLPPPPA
jgi:post-segregation antitoxin (ccd killing protein)